MTDLSDYCEVCGDYLYEVTCWACGGAGGFRDCGEDPCCRLDPGTDLNDTCEECGGAGTYPLCAHAVRARKEEEKKS